MTIPAAGTQSSSSGAARVTGTTAEKVHLEGCQQRTAEPPPTHTHGVNVRCTPPLYSSVSLIRPPLTSSGGV